MHDSTEPTPEAIEVTPEDMATMDQEKEVFVQLYELVKEHQTGDLSFFQLRDRSQRLRKLTDAIKHVLEDGGAPATAVDLVAQVVDMAGHAENADDFFRELSDPRQMPSGSAELNFYRHYLAGVRAEQAAKSQAA